MQNSKAPVNGELPLPIAYDPPRFSVVDDEAMQFLEEHGYLVIKNVASVDEINTAHRLFWLESILRAIN
jgi:hypothetical protein